jgi:hypothetical protein
MNNYLTSIAARTLNPDHSVRPRLGGRFEPASLAEGPIDSANSSRLPAKHSQPDSQQVGAIETTAERDSNNQPVKTFDLAIPDRPTVHTPELNSAATTAQPVTGPVVDPSPSATIRAPQQQTPAEVPRQNLPAELPPDEKVFDVAEHREFRSSRPTDSRTQNWPEPRIEESPNQSVLIHHQTTEEVEPTARPSRPTIKPSSSADDEQEPVTRPAITRKQSLVERELETIVIREKAIRDESPLNQASAKSLPTPVAESADTIENSRSKTSPVLVHSRIAPLIETGPEHVRLNQPAIQPQPTVHVTIGRIEVRAVQSSRQPTSKSRAETPVMNLDDYLRRRSQGGAQ